MEKSNLWRRLPPYEKCTEVDHIRNPASISHVRRCYSSAVNYWKFSRQMIPHLKNPLLFSLAAQLICISNMLHEAVVRFDGPYMPRNPL